MPQLVFLSLLIFSILGVCLLGLLKIKNSKRGVIAKILLGFIGSFILLALAWLAYVLLYWGPRVGKM